jgi:hypothetical protein
MQILHGVEGGRIDPSASGRRDQQKDRAFETTGADQFA